MCAPYVDDDIKYHFYHAFDMSLLALSCTTKEKDEYDEENYDWTTIVYIEEKKNKQTTISTISSNSKTR